MYKSALQALLHLIMIKMSPVRNPLKSQQCWLWHFFTWKIFLEREISSKSKIQSHIKYIPPLMVTEVLIYSNIALGRKLVKAMKIAKSIIQIKLSIFILTLKSLFKSMVKLKLDSKTPLRVTYIFIDAFHEDTRKGISSDHKPNFLNFFFTPPLR